MALKLITPPVILPVTVSEAKIHERIDIDDAANDASILSLLTAATQLAENYTRRAFIEQTWRYETPNFGPIMSIPRPPLIRVDPATVFIVDNYNVATLVDANLYFTNDTYQPARFIWKGFILPSEVSGGCNCYGVDDYEYSENLLRMNFQAGYGATADLVPWEIKEGILQIFGSLYENRESQLIPGGAQQLLAPYKVEYL